VLAVPPKLLGGGATQWAEAVAASKAEDRLPFSVSIPADARAGRYVVAVDVKFGKWELPRFSETIVDVVR